MRWGGRGRKRWLVGRGRWANPSRTAIRSTIWFVHIAAGTASSSSKPAQPRYDRNISSIRGAIQGADTHRYSPPLSPQTHGGCLPTLSWSAAEVLISSPASMARAFRSCITGKNLACHRRHHKKTSPRHRVSAKGGDKKKKSRSSQRQIHYLLGGFGVCTYTTQGPPHSDESMYLHICDFIKNCLKN